MVSRMVGFCLILAATSASAGAAEDGERRCYSKVETREHIHEERLAEPFAVIRATAGALRAEALGARLCRSNGTTVYEIDLLDRSGRIIHAIVDAATGRLKTKP